MDFGLFEDTPNTIRKTTYPTEVFYYVLLFDIAVKSTWIAQIASSSVPGSVTIVLWALECIRRFQWNCVRVELEHVHNCNENRFTTLAQYPLAIYDSYVDDHYNDESMEHDEIYSAEL